MCKFALDLIRIEELSLMCDERLRATGPVDDWKKRNISLNIRDVKIDEVEIQVRVCWTCAREHAKKACVNVTYLYAASVCSTLLLLVFLFGSGYAGIEAACSNRFNN